MEAIHPLLSLDRERVQILTELVKVHNWYKLLYLEPEVAPVETLYSGHDRGHQAGQDPPGNQAASISRRRRSGISSTCGT